VRARCGTCFFLTLQRALGLCTADALAHLGTQFLIFSALVMAIGRAWCGWICPMGFVQDVLDKFRQWLGIGHVRFSSRLRKRLKVVKWIFLGVALLIPIWVAFPVLFPSVAQDLFIPFCQMCPGKYILPLTVANPDRIALDFQSATTIVMSVLGLTFSIMLIIGSFVKRRFWCHYCPLGLMLSWYRKISALRLVKDDSKCTHCEICYNVCPMEIEEVFKEKDKKDVTFQECTLCLKCIEHCPEEDALSAKYMGATVYRSTNKRFFNRHLGRIKPGRVNTAGKLTASPEAEVSKP
jgi:polyferredoxin